MRYAVLLTALCAALVVSVSGEAAVERQAPILALVGNGTTESVVRLDPITLRQIKGTKKVYVGLHDIPQAFSPDGSLLALGSGRTSSLAIVDLRRMRKLLWRRPQFTSAAAWVSARQLVVVKSASGALVATVLTVGTNGVRVSARYPLPPKRTLVGFAQTASAAVLLLAEEEQISTASLAVVEPDRLRTVSLDGIAAGSVPPDYDSADPVSRYAYPGLAVNPTGNRAFVVPGEGPVAEVDLSTLTVSYHTLAAGADRLADGGGNIRSDGSFRRATWIGDGLLAVSGADEHGEPGPAGPTQVTDLAGVQLIDTTTWEARQLDEHAEWSAWTGRFLATVSFEPRRLSVFDGDGRLLWRRADTGNGVQLGRDHAYVTLGLEYRRHRVRVIDLATGRAVSTVWVPGWFHPLNRAHPESCWC